MGNTFAAESGGGNFQLPDETFWGVGGSRPQGEGVEVFVKNAVIPDAFDHAGIGGQPWHIWIVQTPQVPQFAVAAMGESFRRVVGPTVKGFADASQTNGADRRFLVFFEKTRKHGQREDKCQRREFGIAIQKLRSPQGRAGNLFVRGQFAGPGKAGPVRKTGYQMNGMDLGRPGVGMFGSGILFDIVDFVSADEGPAIVSNFCENIEIFVEVLHQHLAVESSTVFVREMPEDIRPNIFPDPGIETCGIFGVQCFVHTISPYMLICCYETKCSTVEGECKEKTLCAAFSLS